MDHSRELEIKRKVSGIPYETLIVELYSGFANPYFSIRDLYSGKFIGNAAFSKGDGNAKLFGGDTPNCYAITSKHLREMADFLDSLESYEETPRESEARP